MDAELEHAALVAGGQRMPRPASVMLRGLLVIGRRLLEKKRAGRLRLPLNATEKRALLAAEAEGR